MIGARDAMGWISIPSHPNAAYRINRGTLWVRKDGRYKPVRPIGSTPAGQVWDDQADFAAVIAAEPNDWMTAAEIFEWGIECFYPDEVVE